MDGARSLESESRHSRGLPGAMNEQAELKKTTDRILVAIPTYDEIENLPLLVDEIFSRVPQVEILVVDDNSPDGTGDWAEQRAAQDSRLSCLHRAGRLGLGTATLEAFVPSFAVKRWTLLRAPTTFARCYGSLWGGGLFYAYREKPFVELQARRILRDTTRLAVRVWYR